MTSLRMYSRADLDSSFIKFKVWGLSAVPPALEGPKVPFCSGIGIVTP